MGLFGERSTALHKEDQMPAQKVCLRLVIQFLHRLLAPVAEFIIILPSMALYCNPIFFTYKLVLGEGRSAANRLWKIPDISNFMCTRSCSQPYLCLPVLSCAQVTQQKYLEQGTNVLTSRHWDFGEGIFFFTSSPPLHLAFFISSFSPLFEQYQAVEGRSTCMWLSYLRLSLISLSFRSLISYQKCIISIIQHSRQRWKC